MIERAMVVTAHPDDAETGAAGTVAKLVRQGVEVTYVIVTKGNAGSEDRNMTPDRLATIRTAEKTSAAETLRVKHVEFLGTETERSVTRETSGEISPVTSVRRC